MNHKQIERYSKILLGFKGTTFERIVIHSFTKPDKRYTINKRLDAWEEELKDKQNEPSTN